MGDRSIARHRPVRSMRALTAVLLVWAGAIGLVGVPMAAACSCAPITVADAEEMQAVAFVGTVTVRGAPLDRPVGGADWATTPFVFSVERWLLGGPDGADGTASVAAGDGAEITVHSSSDSGGGCGFAIGVGDRVAVVASERDGFHVGGLCSTIPAEVALAEIDPPPARDGTARLAVIGDFGGALVAYFDGQGRFLGYGGEAYRDSDPETTRFAWRPGAVPCRDGRHALVQTGPTFRIVAVATGEDVTEPMRLAEDLGTAAMWCRQPTDAQIIEYEASGQGVVLRDLATGTVRPLLDRFNGLVAFNGRSITTVEALDPGERLVTVDIGPGAENDDSPRELGRLDRSTDDDYRGYASLAMAPDGNQLGVLEVDYRGGGFDDVRSTIRIFDPATGRERVSRTIEGETWGAHWVDAEHLGLVFGSDEVDHIEILDASSLDVVGSVGGWRPHRSTLVDGVLWGVDDGSLVRAELGEEPVVVFGFPARTWAPVFVLEEPVVRSGTTSPVDRPDDDADSTIAPVATADGRAPASVDATEADEPDSAAIGEGPTDPPGGDGGRWWLGAGAIGATLAIVALAAGLGRRSGGPTTVRS